MVDEDHISAEFEKLEHAYSGPAPVPAPAYGQQQPTPKPPSTIFRTVSGRGGVGA